MLLFYSILFFTFCLISGALPSFAQSPAVEPAATERAQEDNGKENGEVAVVTAQAYVEIKGTKEGSTLNGQAVLSQTKDGVIIDVEVFNVPDPGLHGFHIHENGSCGDGGNAAGTHYNPDSVGHGNLIHAGHGSAHAGDMGNIEINAEGYGTYTALLPGLTLTGEKYNISNRAIILHEKADDFSQPVGNAGGRIGCGVIVKK